MKLTVKKFGELTGVSVRTLHHYDAIGLLSPDFTDPQTGYRYYGEQALRRMQAILFYRELDFPLQTIGELLASPQYDTQAALREQKRLLLLKKQRLERVIAALEWAEKGESMDFQAFDNSQMEAYKEEVRQRWGATAAYAESATRTAAYTAADWHDLQQGMEVILADFAAAKAAGEVADGEIAEGLAARLQAFITDTQYTCTDEILLGLGEMYVADERFTANIDRHGAGTAAYIREAIRHFCGENQ